MKVRVLEVTRKQFENNVYYNLMVQGIDNDKPDGENKCPIGLVNSKNECRVGQVVTLGYIRNKDMKLVATVLG